MIIDHAEHPIPETARNLGPALLVVTFDAVFAFLAPALRQGADDPPVRASCSPSASRDLLRRRIIVPWPPLGIREYKSPTKAKDFREGFLGRLTVQARPPAAVGRCSRCWRSPASPCSSAASPSRTRSRSRATRCSGSTRAARPSRTSRRRATRPAHRSELGIFVQRTRRVLRGDRRLRERRWARASSTDLPASSSSRASSLVDHHGLPDRGARARRSLPPTGEDVREALRRGPAGHPAVHRRPTTARPPTCTFRSGPSSLEQRKVIVNDIRVKVTHPTASWPRPRASPPPRRAWPSSASACSRTSPPTGPCSPTSRSRSSACSGCFRLTQRRALAARRWCRCSSPSALAPTSWPARPQAQPDHRGRRPARGRRLHRVHVADPVALPRGATRGPARRDGAVDVAAARTGRAFIVSALTAVPGIAVMLFSPLPLLRDFGIVVGHHRGRRPALGAHRAATAAGLGRQPRLGRRRSRPPAPTTAASGARDGPPVASRRRLTSRRPRARTGSRRRACGRSPDPGLAGG